MPAFLTLSGGEGFPLSTVKGNRIDWLLHSLKRNVFMSDNELAQKLAFEYLRTIDTSYSPEEFLNEYELRFQFFKKLLTQRKPKAVSEFDIL